MLHKCFIRLSVLMLTLLSSAFTVSAAGQADSLAAAHALTQEDVDMVLGVFDGMQPYEIISRTEALINTGNSDEEAASIAYSVYRYYRESRIMGYDEVALYVADTYFLSGKYKLQDEEALLEMRLFVETNRHSMIGMKAPRMLLQDPAGTDFQVPSVGQDYSILYFYDDECPGCRRMTPMLMQYLMQGVKGLNVTVYMVYTQDDRQRWTEYVAKMVSPFDIPDNVTVVNLWNPDMRADIVMDYGVISTPKLFLVDRNGVIVGRELTPVALSQAIDLNESRLTPMEELMDQIFSPIAESGDTVEVEETIDAFFQDSKDNPEFFHEVFYTLYQFLRTSPSYVLQQGAAYLANKYIVSMPEMWETVEFTDKGVTSGSVIRADYASVDDFLDQTALAVLMFYRNPLDKPVADLELRTVNNKKLSVYDVKARYTVLYFYNMDCGLCNAVSEALCKIQNLYNQSDVRVVAIYTGTDRKWKKYVKEHERPWLDVWDRKRDSGMFDKYDLLDVPAIYLLDENKVTLAKDINPDVLGVLLEYYLTQD